MDVHRAHGSSIITLTQDGQGATARYPLYRIDNNTTDAFLIRQECDETSTADGNILFAEPGSSSLFGWDSQVDALKRSQLQVLALASAGVPISINLHDCTAAAKVTLGASPQPAAHLTSNTNVRVHCVCDGFPLSVRSSGDAVTKSRFSVCSVARGAACCCILTCVDMHVTACDAGGRRSLSPR